MNNLLSSLPPRYSDCGQITLLLQALEQELARLEAAVQAVAARGLLATADEAGLRRWEDDLGLSHRPDLSPDARRAILQAALDRNCHGTTAALKEYTDRLVGSTDTRLQQDYASYALTFTVPQHTLLDLYSLQHWVRKRLPAHVSSRIVQSAVENS